MGQQRRTYTDDFKAAAVDQLYETARRKAGFARRLGSHGHN